MFVCLFVVVVVVVFFLRYEASKMGRDFLDTLCMVMNYVRK